MLNLSDRDSKIILVLLIVAVIVLPYIFYSKNTRAETEEIKGEIISLEERLNTLREMNKNRDFYVAETERMKKERDELIASFPAEIDPENFTMFLQYLEVNSIVQAEENMLALEEDDDDETPRFGYSGIDGDSTVLIGTVSYGENDYIQISDEESDELLMGVINESDIGFACHYDGLRYILDYILNYEDPMIYNEVVLDYNDERAEINGEMKISQYAISGQGRTLENVPVWPDLDENELRGITKEHLFGPLSIEGLYTHQMFEVYLKQKAAEAEEEEENGADFDLE